MAWTRGQSQGRGEVVILNIFGRQFTEHTDGLDVGCEQKVDPKYCGPSNEKRRATENEEVKRQIRSLPLKMPSLRC